MVLLHGYLSSKEAFAAQVDYFSRFYRVTAFDFIGQGASEPLQSPYSVEDYAVWTEEVLSLLGVKSPSVIAHSFGCRVLIKMAKRGRQVFDKLILTGPAGVVLPKGVRYRCKVAAYRFVRRLYRFLIRALRIPQIHIDGFLVGKGMVCCGLLLL